MKKTVTYVCCDIECAASFKVYHEKDQYTEAYRPDAEVEFCPFCGHNVVLPKED